MDGKKRCPGCGAIFQTTDENLPGYLAQGKNPAGGVLCKRCFQMKHYGVFRKALVSDAAIQREIKKRARESAAIFLILDVTRPEISGADLDWGETLRKPLFLIANKADLLSRWVTRKELLAWISERTGVPKEQIILLSARKKSEVEELRTRISETFDAEDRILFAGSANVGKSTLLSALLKNDDRPEGGNTRSSYMPTVSRLPGTTVGITEYRMQDGPVLVDAPGLRGGDPFLPVLCPDCLASLSPKKTFTSSVSVFKTGQTVFFGGLAQVTVEDAGERGWVRLGIFAPDGVTIHKSREERIDELMKDHTGELLVPPCEKCAARLAAAEWKKEAFRLRPEEDLVIPGLGWVALYSGACAASVRAPDFVRAQIRPWLVPSPARRKTGKK